MTQILGSPDSKPAPQGTDVVMPEGGKVKIMKLSLILIVGLLTFGGIGSQYLRGASARYVDSHRCFLVDDSPDMKIYDFGIVRTVPGFTVYNCPDSVTVVIENDDPQPRKEPK